MKILLPTASNRFVEMLTSGIAVGGDRSQNGEKSLQPQGTGGTNGPQATREEGT